MAALPQTTNGSQQATVPGAGYGAIRAGNPAELKSRVLSLVGEESYDSAINEIDRFMRLPSEFPNYLSRVHRYLEHAIELVAAIEAKRSFPGKFTLTKARQQELNDKVRHHYRELQIILDKVEFVQVSLMADDLRSTVWTVRAFTLAITAVLGCAFFIELYTGLMSTGIYLMEVQINAAVNWIFQAMNF